MTNVTAKPNRNNCFNLIRLIAALQVFFGHACTHFEMPMPSGIEKVWNTFRGVPVFFMLSGFLLWSSLNRDNRFFTYCKKRVLRLYPELWGGVFLNAVIILLVFGVGGYVVPFILHILCQSTVLQFWTPEFLRGYGCGTPNGSLWTIGVMVQCYIVFYFVHKLLRNKKIGIQLVVFVLFAGCNFLPHLVNRFLPETLAKLFSQTFVPYFWLFLAGGLISEHFDRIIDFIKKWWFIFFGVSVIISFSGFENNIGAYELFKSLTLGFAIVGFAYRFSNLNIEKDYSYGFYIYHMIVINFMIQSGYIGNIIYIPIALVISFIFSILSQFIVNKLTTKA